ncbi:MAG: hypothetical protein HGA44_12460 [Cellulomonadaceae bacterium]|nr:hypothetical protein [Cellulomonadaceae bacterium]
MRRAPFALVVVLCVVGGLGLASAATLAVTSSSVSAAVATNPCPGTAAAGPGAVVATATQTFGGVAVTMPAGCGARTVQVTVLNGTTVRATGSGVVNGSGTVATGSYVAAAGLTVKATVDGWDLPATWTYRPYVSCRITTVGSTKTCSAAITVVTGTKPGGSTEALYYDVAVTTTSTTYVPWEVTFYLDDPVYGAVPTRLGNSDLDGFSDGSTTWGTNPANDVTRSSACSALPVLTVVGEANGPTGNRFNVVRSNRPRNFSIVVNRTEVGYSDVIAPGCA